MALEREARSIGWEKEDDRKREGKNRNLVGGVEGLKIVDKKEEVKEVQEKKEKVPSVALMGVSMLGNLDGMYSHKNYHGIVLHTYVSPFSISHSLTR